MKKNTFEYAPTALKLGFRRGEAAEALGSVQLLDDMERADWLVPVVNRHKLKIYDRGDIQRAWARVLAGELPPARKRNHRLSENAVAKTASAPRPEKAIFT